MGTKIKVVPEEHWNIIRQYINGDAVVLVRESVLDQMENKKHAETLKSGALWHMDYDFGGNADVWVDFVESTEHMAWNYFFPKHNQEEDIAPSVEESSFSAQFHKESDGFFSYYVNVDTGEKKFKRGSGDVLVDTMPDDFIINRKGVK